jgi:sodium/bile acid cotransporter 7
MKRIARNWFLLSLVGVLYLGFAGSNWLDPLTRLGWLQSALTASVLFLTALPLPAADLVRSIREPAPALLACAVNMVLVPLAAWSISPLLTDGSGIGLCVTAAVPCTLASAAVWTRRAGGNDAAAILVTLLTNATCFLVTPLWLSVMTGRAVQSPALQFASMSQTLALLVVLPMVAAQTMRFFPRVSAGADAHRAPLAVLAQLGILLMVLLGAIHSGRGMDADWEATAFFRGFIVLLLVVLGLHLAALFGGIRLAAMLRMSPRDQLAVGFAGSQKTLMVGVVIAISLRVTILPMVVWQVLQLVADTVIADRLRLQEPQGGCR